ncbi:PIN-like domain-containing protein [Priestia sp. BR_2]
MDLSLDKYFFKPKEPKEIINTAYIVVDTSVLLSAYQWKEVTFKEMLRILNEISSEKRLKIPYQVFKEFTDQRPRKIKETIEKLNTQIYSKIQKTTDLISVVPFFEMLEDNEKLEKTEEEYVKARKEYRKSLEDLSKRLRLLFQDDLVLNSIQPLFEENCYLSFDYEELSNEAKQRQTDKLPPLTGGDQNKKENNYGDYYIWKDILSLNGDVIFVTTDTKEDWFYKDHEKNILAPRRELIEEFYEKNNKKTVCIVPLKEFVTILNPKTKEAVIEDISKNNQLDQITQRLFEIRYLANYVEQNPNSFRKGIYDNMHYFFNYGDIDISDTEYLTKDETNIEYIYMKITSSINYNVSDLKKVLIGGYADGSQIIDIKEQSISDAIKYDL